MEIHESAEDYLETILMLTERIGNVRSVDISNEMGFKKSSVSVAMKNLRNTGHIVVDENGYIKLTVLGKEVADMIYERHKFFSSWLMKLGVNKETALEDACRIEHVISKESFAAIKSFLNSYNN
nr:metal-dependent transcriptional regulator [uncultured Catonella sp.]